VARKPKFLRRGRKLGDEIAARMNIGEEARCRDLLGDRHAAIGLVALEHQDLEAGSREVAGAGQPVVPGADHDGFVRARHSLYVLTLNVDLGKL